MIIIIFPGYSHEPSGCTKSRRMRASVYEYGHRTVEARIDDNTVSLPLVPSTFTDLDTIRGKIGILITQGVHVGVMKLCPFFLA